MKAVFTTPAIHNICLYMQKLNSGAQSASDRHSADLGRASVTLRATAETSGRDLLRGAAFGSQPSEGLSVCGEEGLVPGLPKKSLKVLLSNDPLILGARQDFDGSSFTSLPLLCDHLILIFILVWFVRAYWCAFESLHVDWRSNL